MGSVMPSSWVVEDAEGVGRLIPSSWIVEDAEDVGQPHTLFLVVENVLRA